MPSPLRDRRHFVIAAIALGTVMGVLNLRYTNDEGWILAIVMELALIIPAFRPAMPGWLLLAAVGLPTFIGEALVLTQGAYLVVIIAMAIVAAGRPGHADLTAMILCLISPFILRITDTSEWNHGIGAWMWFGGLLIGWAFGYVVGRQWELIDELDRTRAALAAGAVAADRQRIARELHDLVGQSFSVVLLHLSGARLILDQSPRDAADALRQAETVGRTGMDELRQALMLMRQGTDPPRPAEPGDLDRILGTYRDAGLRLDVTVNGGLGTVDAASRIVLHDVLRESLTNVAKHADAAEAVIRIDVTDDAVTARISSPAGTRRPGRPGMGLSGLEHRVAAVDGAFRAGTEAERWVVETTLPRRLAGVPG